MISETYNISLEAGDMPKNTQRILNKLVATKDDDGNVRVTPEDK